MQYVSLRKTISVMLVCLLFVPAIAQKTPGADEAATYTKVITERAHKIVATLGIEDSKKALSVQNLIRDQYRNLNDVQTKREEEIKAAKANQANAKDAIAAEVKSIEDKAAKKITKLHTKYVSKLNSKLTDEQVEKVKDGMTYGVVPITYKGYLAMLPQLTDAQKDQIMAWLVEAREHAMDAESSEKKHGWFGKYKGRINNYLSAAGYDMKKASDDWAKKVKEEAAAKD